MRRSSLLLTTLVLIAVGCTPPPAPPTTTTTTTTTTTPSAPTADVFVVAQNLGAVLQVDPISLEISRTIELGVADINSLAVIGDDLWYGHGRTGGGIGRFDLDTGDNQTNVIASTRQPLVRTSPASPGVLFVGEQGVSPGNISKYDVTVTPPTRLARTVHGDIGSNLKDFEVSADGSRLWSASGAPYEVVEIRATDMTVSGRIFPMGGYGAAVDNRVVDGDEFLAGGASSASDPDVHVFDPTNPAIVDEYITGRRMEDGGLALSVDGSRTYSVHASGATTDAGELIAINRSNGVVTRTTIRLPDRFNGGIGVEPGSGRVFVGTYNSVSVFNERGQLVGTLPAVAGPTSIAVIPH